MLTELRAEKYKSFRGPAIFPLRQITVLLGKNNSGKTAAARLPLFMLSSVGVPNRSAVAPLGLQVRGLDYGSSLLELTYGQQPHSPFKLGIDLLRDSDQAISIRFAIQHRQSLELGQSAFVSEFSAKPLVDAVYWRRGDAPPRGKPIEYSDSFVSRFRGVLPVFEDERSEQISRLEGYANDYFHRMVHLRSNRTSIRAIYENRPPSDTSDTSGAEAPYMLQADAELEFHVARWFAEQLDIHGLGVDGGGSAFSLSLRGAADNGPNVARVGQGVQQVLPVATYLAAMAHGRTDSSFLTIEEPELHLHPAAHVAIADLIVEAARSSSSNQLLIETHSENLLLRLRRHVAEGVLTPSQLCLLWFEHSDQEGSTVRQIEVRPDGSVDSWPQGIFAEDLKEVQAIVRAGRR